MNSRLIELKLAWEGFSVSHLPLVGFDGSRFCAVNQAGDPGIFFLIPFFGKSFGLSLQMATQVFFYGLISFSLAIGLMGIWKLVSVRRFLLALAYYAFVASRMQDVYCVYALAPMTLCPWIIWFEKKGLFSASQWTWNSGFWLVAGLFSGFMEIIRSGASLILIPFIFGITFWRYDFFKFIAVFVFGAIMPSLFMQGATMKAEKFLELNGVTASLNLKHPLFHNAYLGLGYTRNPDGIIHEDQFAFNKFAPAKYGSVEYGKASAVAFFHFIFKNPFFYFKQVFEKAGGVLFIALFYLNVSLFRKQKYKYPLLAGMAVAAIPGILVIPDHSYLLGVVGYSVVWWSFSE
jgi:hypothetical protein